MLNSRKKPRATVHPSKFLQVRGSLEQQVAVVDAQQEHKVEELKKEPAEFFKQVLGFKPFEYQGELIRLFAKNQFLAARWCRQSGKSWRITL
jgi:hypothetical protein